MTLPWQRERTYTPYERGLLLLKLVLSPEEHRRWSTGGGLWITGSEGGRYNIKHDQWEGNVFYYEGSKQVASFCAHLRRGWDELPASDNAVAQVLAIKRDEFAFLRLANIYGCWDREAAVRRKQQAEAARQPIDRSPRWWQRGY